MNSSWKSFSHNKNSISQKRMKIILILLLLLFYFPKLSKCNWIIFISSFIYFHVKNFIFVEKENETKAGRKKVDVLVNKINFNTQCLRTCALKGGINLTMLRLPLIKKIPECSSLNVMKLFLIVLEFYSSFFFVQTSWKIHQMRGTSDE